MPFDARVYHVLIASPGDVPPERKAVANVIARWNQGQSAERGAVFIPRMWETDSTPSMEAHPQDVINRQIVDDADLLIGIFWQKLGTPTARNVSGTVEEINRIIDRRGGENVLLYFSDKRVSPRSFNASEFQKLEEFREGIKKRGLFRHFKNVPELSRLVATHLTERARSLGEFVPFQEQTESIRGTAGSVTPASLPGPAEALLKALARASMNDEGAYVRTTHLVGDEDLYGMPEEEIRDAADVLRRRGLARIVEDAGVFGLDMELTGEGLTWGLPAVVSNYPDHAEGVRAAICRLSPTTVEAIAGDLGLAPNLVEHITKQLQADRLVRVRRYADVTKVDDPSPELCPRQTMLTPRPRNLSPWEHEIMRELLRRVTTYPDVFEPTVWKLPAGDNKQPYQSARIEGAVVPEAAKHSLEADHDFFPILVSQGYLIPLGKYDFRLDESIFPAYGFPVPR